MPMQIHCLNGLRNITFLIETIEGNEMRKGIPIGKVENTFI
jgi:hypothetical protein